MLLSSEQDAFRDWVTECFSGPKDFRSFLAKNGCKEPPIFAMEPLAIETVGFSFVEWLNINLDAVEAVVKAAILEFPRHENVGLFCIVAERCKRRRTAQGALPWDADLIDGIPMVNRGPLRAILQRVLKVRGPSVAMINGPSGCGRSHSWHLIRNVARSLPCDAIKIDLAAFALEECSIESLFDRLVRKLRLQAVRPTTAGTTAETIAARFAEAIADALNARALPYWLVFDGLDATTVLPEMRLFIGHIATRRLEYDIGSGVIFLIGAAADYGVDDRYRRVEMETVSDMLPSEFEKTAAAINDAGEKPLVAMRLREWMDCAIKDMRNLRGREAGALIIDRLLDLRDLVEAA